MAGLGLGGDKPAGLCGEGLAGWERCRRPLAWSFVLAVALLGAAPGCAPPGERYRLLLPPAALREPHLSPVRQLLFPRYAVSAGQSNFPEFVFTESPIEGLYYGAWNSCAGDRDEMFYTGFRRDAALELQPLGCYAEVYPYCGFSLTTDGDNILVFGGTTRPGAGFFQVRLHSQVLLLDPEWGTTRRLSPPAGFRRRLSYVFFDRQVGSYILKDHRNGAYRLHLP